MPATLRAAGDRAVARAHAARSAAVANIATPGASAGMRRSPASRTSPKLQPELLALRPRRRSRSASSSAAAGRDPCGVVGALGARPRWPAARAPARLRPARSRGTTPTPISRLGIPVTAPGRPPRRPSPPTRWSHGHRDDDAARATRAQRAHRREVGHAGRDPVVHDDHGSPRHRHRGAAVAIALDAAAQLLGLALDRRLSISRVMPISRHACPPPPFPSSATAPRPARD